MAYDDTLFQLGMDLTRSSTAQKEELNEIAPVAQDERKDFFIERDGVGLGAINPWMAEGMPVSWLPYFGVADIEAAKAAAQSSGGTITHDVHEVPGGDFIFTATDPAGAPVAFVGPKGA